MRQVGLYRIGALMEIVGQPPAGVAGAAYSFTFTGLGGSSPYTFAGVSMPSGWAVSSGGALTHAGPSAGTYSITVVMNDSQRNVPVTQTYSVVIQ